MSRAGRLVDLLTGGEPITLDDAYDAAGYSRSLNLESFLRSPYVMLRFKQALAEGRALPPRHADKILAAIAEFDD